MELSPSKAESPLASQEVPGLIWNPKVHYHVHKCLGISGVERSNSATIEFDS
jgi:hypothetical protein